MEVTVLDQWTQLEQSALFAEVTSAQYEQRRKQEMEYEFSTDPEDENQRRGIRTCHRSATVVVSDTNADLGLAQEMPLRSPR